MFDPISLFLVTLLAWAVFDCWYRQSGDNTGHNSRWLALWLLKGVGLPLVIWMLCNAGHPPLVPGFVKLTLDLPAKPTAYDKFKADMFYIAIQTAPAVVVVISYWSGLTTAWFAFAAWRRTVDRDMVGIVTAFWSLLALPAAWFIHRRFGFAADGFSLAIWSAPIAYYAQPLRLRISPIPMYAQAIANLKRGRYTEAEQSIIAQLEKCENDFEGWMMLAELYADHFQDLTEAERSILSLCDDPATTAPQVSIALHKLADWQLKWRRDVSAARRVLEEISRRMPDTHLAKMAQLRIGQLPASDEALGDPERTRKKPMPALNENFGTPRLPADANPGPALTQANQLVERLKRNPDDFTAREELARLFATRLDQVSLAVEQIELLLEIPDPPEGKAAEWLGLLAAWQSQRGDNSAARRHLERLVQEHPQSPQAFAAQRRLSLMNMDARVRRRVA